jgi:hypothetical protein
MRAIVSVDCFNLKVFKSIEIHKEASASHRPTVSYRHIRRSHAAVCPSSAARHLRAAGGTDERLLSDQPC